MIESIREILNDGGLTIYALLVLSTIIYASLFQIWRLLAATKSIVNEPIKANASPLGPEQLTAISRRLPFVGILIGIAPLLGLLGTVAGMLITFSGLASASNAPLDTISSGISRALVTTQAGLVVALPAACLLALLKRSFETAHLNFHRQMHLAAYPATPPAP